MLVTVHAVSQTSSLQRNVENGHILMMGKPVCSYTTAAGVFWGCKVKLGGAYRARSAGGEVGEG